MKAMKRVLNFLVMFNNSFGILADFLDVSVGLDRIKVLKPL
jgi:hypothetical protein